MSLPMLNLHADGQVDDDYIDSDDEMLLTEPMTFRLRIQRYYQLSYPDFFAQ